MTPQDRERDSFGSWALGIQCLLEIAIRAKRIKPRLDRPDEIRWAEAGPVPNNKLESLEMA